MFELNNICHRYQTRPALTLAHWHGEAGSQWLILGPSGSGKTTLLHLMAGLLSPQQGEVKIQQQSLTGLSERQRDQFRARHIGIVLQNIHLIKPLTVLENLRLAQQLAGQRVDLTRIKTVLQQLALTPWQNAYPATLSRGQAQRVAIARAILHRPQLILADEPTASLDDAQCQHVVQLLQAQAIDYGATLVLATHDHRLQTAFQTQLTLTQPALDTADE